MTTTVVAGFFPKTRTSSSVAPLMSSAFCSAVGVPFSLDIDVRHEAASYFFISQSVPIKSVSACRLMPAGG